ncbi:MAG TPA: hypothetical protein VD706_01935 [Candidatus Saccharimonadales bacterium]|nr:hypothetical protein [Candidatus Saccharimonadales bacterium]
MPGEFFPLSEAGAARAHLEATGHVGLDGLYDPSLAEAALADAHDAKIARQGFNRPSREYVTPVRTPYERRQRALYMLIEGVKRGVEALGRNLNPSAPGEQAHYKLLEAGPGTSGSRHHDNPALVDVVAVTNLAGESHLWYEDGTVYDLEPGKTAMHDLGRNLLHRGFTDPDQSRTGLVLAKIGPKRS